MISRSWHHKIKTPAHSYLLFGREMFFIKRVFLPGGGFSAAQIDQPKARQGILAGWGFCLARICAVSP